VIAREFEDEPIPERRQRPSVGKKRRQKEGQSRQLKKTSHGPMGMLTAGIEKLVREEVKRLQAVKQMASANEGSWNGLAKGIDCRSKDPANQKRVKKIGGTTENVRFITTEEDANIGPWKKSLTRGRADYIRMTVGESSGTITSGGKTLPGKWPEGDRTH